MTNNSIAITLAPEVSSAITSRTFDGSIVVSRGPMDHKGASQTQQHFGQRVEMFFGSHEITARQVKTEHFPDGSATAKVKIGGADGVKTI